MRRLFRRVRDWLDGRWQYQPDYTEAGDVILAPEYNERYAGERELQRLSEESERRRQD